MAGARYTDNHTGIWVELFIWVKWDLSGGAFYGKSGTYGQISSYAMDVKEEK
jgi:hypothetical protein